MVGGKKVPGVRIDTEEEGRWPHCHRAEKWANLRATSSFAETIELLKALAQVFGKTSPWHAFLPRGYVHIVLE